MTKANERGTFYLLYICRIWRFCLRQSLSPSLLRGSKKPSSPPILFKGRDGGKKSSFSKENLPLSPFKKDQYEVGQHLISRPSTSYFSLSRTGCVFSVPVSSSPLLPLSRVNGQGEKRWVGFASSVFRERSFFSPGENEVCPRAPRLCTVRTHILGVKEPCL